MPSAAPPPTITIRAHAVAISGAGLEREANEDATGIHRDGELIALSDGMGGLPDGEKASIAAVKAFLRHAPLALAVATSEAVFREGFRVAQTAVQLLGTGAGATLVVARLEPGSVVVAHVGDSRAYLLRGGIARRLTTDHAIGHNLTRCLGANIGRWQPDVERHATQVGDAVMLCSDGLHGLRGEFGLVNDDMIGALWLAAGGDLEQFARRAYDLAMDEGGDDNCSVVVARTR